MPRVQDIHLRSTRALQPAANTVAVGTLYYVTDEFKTERSNGTTWDDVTDSGSSAPQNADYLVGTSNGSLSAEIVVGTTPGGELGGTWDTPTVDATHSGSSHAAIPYTPSDADKWNDATDPGSAQDAIDQLTARVALLERAQEQGSHERITDQIFIGSGLTFSESSESNTLTITAAGGGGLTLVQAQVMTAAVTTVTFSGLAGNTDVMYRLIGRLKHGGGSTTFYYWLPNGLTTNLSSTHAPPPGGSAGTNTSGLLITTNNGGGDIASGYYVSFMMDIFASKNPNSQSHILTYVGQTTVSAPGVGQGVGQIYGFWNETSTELTSITINSDVASQIGNGSVFNLYKYQQS